MMAIWLADVLWSADLSVEETPGWKTRGRGEMVAVKGILVHHTAGAMKGDRPSLNLVLNGRPDLAGPLSQLFLTRAGVWVVLAAGRCNHAGAGSWQGITAGNSNFLGVEAENAGVPADPWPTTQMIAYERGCAAILKHIGADDVMVAGHREYALPRGRKVDPLFDMTQFRSNVAMWMKSDRGAAQSSPADVAPTSLMLQKGDQGKSVAMLQSALNFWAENLKIVGWKKLSADGAFGPGTKVALEMFQHKNGLTVDGRAGPKTWKALGL